MKIIKEVFLIIIIMNYLKIILSIFNINELEIIKNKLNNLELTRNERNNLNINLNIIEILQEDINILKLNNNENNNNEIIKIKNNLLEKSYQKLIDLIDGTKRSKINYHAAKYAIERSKQRKLEEQRLLEKEKLEKEHLVYVSNTRKLELVNGIIDTLRQRAITMELSQTSNLHCHSVNCYFILKLYFYFLILFIDMKELETLFLTYRQLEAQNIFNKTDFQVKLFILVISQL